MDDELYDAFITESEESITQLNNSLLELESNPGDEEAIDDIFRQAHTLKGNFGAMGFDDAATVAHAVEDLLDEIRHDRLAVTPERMDLVFDGMDRILGILREIEADGESSADPTALVEEIRAAVQGETGARGEATGDDADAGADGGTNADEATETIADGDTDAESIGEGASRGNDGAGGDALAAAAAALDVERDDLDGVERLYRADVVLDAGDMRGVDAGLFLGGVPDDVDIVGAEPALDRIEAGEFDDGFSLFVADVPESDLGPALADLWKVERVELIDVSAVLADDYDPVESAGGPGSEADASESEAREADGEPGEPLERATDIAGGNAVDPDAAAEAVAAVEAAYAGSDTADDADDGGGVDPAAEAIAASGADGSTASGTDESTASADGPPASADGDAVGETAGNVDDEAVSDASAAETASGGTDGDADEGSNGADAIESDGADATASNGGRKGRSISAVKSVRVDVGQLDQLHELVEQLVTSRIKLRQSMEGETDATDGLDTLDELDKISSNLQNTVMDMRLIPLKKVFDKFPRLVRDLAREQDKRVRFEVEGEDIELDRTILDEISDPLMHVLRNAVDHGIEPPAVREANGKPRTGTVELAARREHDTVVVTVSDDGGGIDADAVREKAVSKGLATREELNALPDEEVYDYVFHPGFSTNDEITDVSGRGVGMDVVKTTVEAVDGSVSVSSTPGEGSVFTIRLPVSVAIIKVLFVRVGTREFGVPIKYVDELSRRQEVETVNGAEVVVHEDAIFPLVRLRDALDVDDTGDDAGMIVRIRPTDRQIALHCDHVTRQEEVVVTPLQGPLSGTEGLSGTAVIGDGNVVPILDVNTLEIPDGGRRARREWTPPTDDAPGEVEEAAD